MNALKELQVGVEKQVGWTAGEVEAIKKSGRPTFFLGSSGIKKQWHRPEWMKEAQGRSTDMTFDLSAFEDAGYMVHPMQEYKQCTGKETDMYSWAMDNIQRGNMMPNDHVDCAVMCAAYGKAGCCEWSQEQNACKFKTGSLQDNAGYSSYFDTADMFSAMIEKMPEQGSEESNILIGLVEDDIDCNDDDTAAPMGSCDKFYQMYKSGGYDMCDNDANFKKICCATCSKAE